MLFINAIKNRPRTALTLLVLMLLAGVTGGFLQSRHVAQERLQAMLDRSGSSSKKLLEREFENYLIVPEVLAASRHVSMVLNQPSAGTTRELNEMLEETARNVSVDVIFVMDAEGNTLAASNWREHNSFVGKNYSFRPYFQQAIAGNSGRYIAKGVTSHKLGYYLARPAKVEGKVRGVVVAKISFDKVQSSIVANWRDNQELDFITDKNGVVIASPLSAWELTSIEPMTQAARKAIEASRQYGNALTPIAMTRGDALAPQLRFVKFGALPQRSFLQTSYAFPDLELRLYTHISASRYWGIVTQFTTMYSLAVLVIFLACMGLYQRWAYSAKLLEAAIHDPLTGLHTRLYMDDWCAGAIRAHDRDPSAGFGLAVFDLDLFKQVNDVHGHLAGDAVLRGVGALMRKTIRGQDLAVRFGGEELAVFVHCADLAEAVAFAERIRRSVEQFEFESAIGRIPITLSGGVAYHEAGETLDALFARADKKLYEAKELGRNQIRN